MSTNTPDPSAPAVPAAGSEAPVTAEIDYRGLAESTAKVVIEKVVWVALGWKGQSNVIDRVEAHLRERLAPVADPDPGRCPFVNAHYLTNRSRERDDGWRCGKEAGHVNGHYLYSADGETVLDTMGPWVLPADLVVTSPGLETDL